MYLTLKVLLLLNMQWFSNRNKYTYKHALFVTCSECDIDISRLKCQWTQLKVFELELCGSSIFNLNTEKPKPKD